MEWLEQAVVVVHILVALALVGLIMIQQGKGAEAGASFGGGASQTVFGSQGSGSFLTQSTSLLAVVFFVTSISLAMLAKQKAELAASGDNNSLAIPEQTSEAQAKELFEKSLSGTDLELSNEGVEFEQSLDDIKQSLELESSGKPEGFAPAADAAPELE